MKDYNGPDVSDGAHVSNGLNVSDPSNGTHASDGTQAFENLRTAVREYLRYCVVGVDPECVCDTPNRFVKSLQEMTTGYSISPRELLSKTFEESYDEVIILRDIEFVSLCEHHLLPFSGTVDVGYLPGKVVGLSKLARLIDCFSRRLQMQERMTGQIADALQEHLEARGVAVVVKGSHSCVSCRGVRKLGTTFVTSCMLGCFRTEPSARAEFLSLCK